MFQEVFETNKREVTVVMMKNYPQLLRKYVADKAKAPSLIQIVLYMDLELYSLKRQEQVSENACFFLDMLLEGFLVLILMLYFPCPLEFQDCTSADEGGIF